MYKRTYGGVQCYETCHTRATSKFEWRDDDDEEEEDLGSVDPIHAITTYVPIKNRSLFNNASRGVSGGAEVEPLRYGEPLGLYGRSMPMLVGKYERAKEEHAFFYD